jgi:hypothetical protein
LPQQAQLIFGHRPLQPEKQPIVDQARIVSTFGVDHQRSREGAQIDEMVPVAAVAGETGCLEAVDRADHARADGSDQLLEARPVHRT